MNTRGDVCVGTLRSAALAVNIESMVQHAFESRNSPLVRPKTALHEVEASDGDYCGGKCSPSGSKVFSQKCF